MSVRNLNPELKLVYDGFSETFLKSLLQFQRDSHPTEGPQLNVPRLFLDLANRNLNGPNREALEEGARRDGIVFDPTRPYLSFRDLVKASSPSAGYLVSTDVQDPIDVLR